MNTSLQKSSKTNFTMSDDLGKAFYVHLLNFDHYPHELVYVKVNQIAVLNISSSNINEAVR